MICLSVLLGCSPEENARGNGIKEVDMVAKQFEFTPTEIKVKKGDTVKLKMRAVDVVHGFALPEFGVNEVLPPDEIVEVEFLADIKGEFPYQCSVFCGEGEENMKGKLIVE